MRVLRPGFHAGLGIPRILCGLQNTKHMMSVLVLKYQRYHRIPRILCRLLPEYTGHDKRAVFKISIKICGLQNTQDTVRTLNTPNVEQILKTWPGFCADSKYLVCGLQNTQGTMQASEYPGYHASLKSIRKYSRVFRKVLRSFQLFVVSSCLLGGILETTIDYKMPFWPETIAS